MAEAERVKPRSIFVEEAIQFALESRWSDALAVNEQLIERHGADEDAWNRIGKAQTELGHLQEALDAYGRSLELNPLNIIASKNVRRLQQLLESKEQIAGSSAPVDVDVFAEEPGKSGVTVLEPPAKKVSVAVNPADVVELTVDGQRIFAATSRGVALGEVEPKLAHRLAGLVETGNRYTAAVARVDAGQIEIIIRETFQSPENARTPSFPVARGGKRDDFRPYAKESLLASRGVDEEGADLEEDEEVASVLSAAAGDEEEMAGMQTLDDEFEPAGAADTDDEDEDDDSDDDDRPEDSY